MNLKNLLFWNVDTQVDFIEPEGKLYVEGSEFIRPVLDKLTRLAAEKSIRVVNTADCHYPDSPEIDSSPDYIETFPEHCMAGSRGAEFIEETNPEDPLIFDWDKEYRITPDLFETNKYRNYILRKDAFDVFEGNPHSESILNCLNSEIIVVYGVATNVCVDAEVKGLRKREKEVYVVEDAIKELPNLPLPFSDWEELGVKMVKFSELVKMLS